MRDVLDDSQDKQKEQADDKVRDCIKRYEVRDQVLFNAKYLLTHVMSTVFKIKLRPRFIGPFPVVAKKGLAHKLNIPRELRSYHKLYFGLLKPCLDSSHDKIY